MAIDRVGGSRHVDLQDLDDTQSATAASSSSGTAAARGTRGLYGPGEKAPASGQYVCVDARGHQVGKEKTIVKGEPFPPARPGLSFKLVDKTAGIDSSAVGAGGHMTLKPGQTATRSGQYELVDGHGRGLDRATTVVKGEPMPPTPKAGQRWRLADASGTLRAGEKAEISGQYMIVDKNGKPTGNEVTVVKGEPLPPTPKTGQSYRLVDVTKHAFPEKTSKQFRSGQIATASGQYELIGADGKKTGKEVTVVRGEPFPPTPKHGQGYKFKDRTNIP